ncbi:MAG: ferrous iron transport protein A, partial [Oscillospiraceae bacterium]
MLKTVADLKPGQTGVVIKVGGQGAVK